MSERTRGDRVGDEGARGENGAGGVSVSDESGFGAAREFCVRMGFGDGGVCRREENRRAVFDRVGKAEGRELEDFQEYSAAVKAVSSDSWLEKTLSIVRDTSQSQAHKTSHGAPANSKAADSQKVRFRATKATPSEGLQPQSERTPANSKAAEYRKGGDTLRYKGFSDGEGRDWIHSRNLSRSSGVICSQRSRMRCCMRSRQRP